LHQIIKEPTTFGVDLVDEVVEGILMSFNKVDKDLDSLLWRTNAGLFGVVYSLDEIIDKGL